MEKTDWKECFHLLVEKICADEVCQDSDIVFKMDEVVDEIVKDNTYLEQEWVKKNKH